jgi:hypothetical protein
MNGYSDGITIFLRGQLQKHLIELLRKGLLVALFA